MLTTLRSQPRGGAVACGPYLQRPARERLLCEPQFRVGGGVPVLVFRRPGTVHPVGLEHERGVGPSWEQRAVARSAGVVVVELDDPLLSHLLGGGMREAGVTPPPHAGVSLVMWQIEVLVVFQ